MVTPIWCDVCGDIVVAYYPCKFIFHNENEIPVNICPDCIKNGKLIIDLPRRTLISILLRSLKDKEVNEK